MPSSPGASKASLCWSASPRARRTLLPSLPNVYISPSPAQQSLAQQTGGPTPTPTPTPTLVRPPTHPHTHLQPRQYDLCGDHPVGQPALLRPRVAIPCAADGPKQLLVRAKGRRSKGAGTSQPQQHSAPQRHRLMSARSPMVVPVMTAKTYASASEVAPYRQPGRNLLSKTGPARVCAIL